MIQEILFKNSPQGINSPVDEPDISFDAYFAQLQEGDLPILQISEDLALDRLALEGERALEELQLDQISAETADLLDSLMTRQAVQPRDSLFVSDERGVVDEDKRRFLKATGALGLAAVLSACGVSVNPFEPVPVLEQPFVEQSLLRESSKFILEEWSPEEEVTLSRELASIEAYLKRDLEDEDIQYINDHVVITRGDENLSSTEGGIIVNGSEFLPHELTHQIESLRGPRLAWDDGVATYMDLTFKGMDPIDLVLDYNSRNLPILRDTWFYADFEGPSNYSQHYLMAAVAIQRIEETTFQLTGESFLALYHNTVKKQLSGSLGGRKWRPTEEEFRYLVFKAIPDTSDAEVIWKFIEGQHILWSLNSEP